MPLHMRLPKLKGFKNRVPHRVPGRQHRPTSAQLFPEGGAVGVDDLVAKGAVRKNQLVKVLGEGEISVAVQVTVDAFSASGQGEDRRRRRHRHRALTRVRRRAAVDQRRPRLALVAIGPIRRDGSARPVRYGVGSDC